MTHTETIDGRLDEREVLERLPEVELIDDDELREQAVDVLARGVPEYFWDVPATSSGRYHNPFSRNRHGLWIHVKMVFTAYERFVDSFVQMGLIDDFEADCGRIAVLLHDMLKYGHAYESGKSTVKNHDLLAGHWVRNNSDLPSCVVECIEAHNGDWYEGPAPRYQTHPLEQLVHMADMTASDKNMTCGVYKPANKIKQKYPNIPRADL
jgi:hypothetical protein